MQNKIMLSAILSVKVSVLSVMPLTQLVKSPQNFKASWRGWYSFRVSQNILWSLDIAWSGSTLENNFSEVSLKNQELP